MDKKTFDELFAADELSLILMDGGADLTKEQLAKVKARAEEQKQEKLQEMAMELAGTPGYMEFMTMPLISKIMGDAFKKPSKEKTKQTQKQQTPDTPTKQENNTKSLSKKDPNFATIGGGTEQSLKTGDSSANILGKMYNFMKKSYESESALFDEEQTYNQKVEELKDQRLEELIGLFAGKKGKPKKKEKKPEEPKKPTEKPTEKPAAKPTEKPAAKPTEKPAAKPTEKPAAKPTEKPAPKAPTKPTAKLAPETAPPVSTAAKVVTGVGLAATAGSVQAMIARHEGAIPYPYKDSKGLWTIGVGHLIGNGKSLPPEYDAWKNNGGPYDKKNNTTPALTPEQMQKLFDEDFKKHYDLAKKGPGFDKAPETVQNAFIDLTYNMGAWWTIFKQAAKSAEMGDFESTAKHLQDSKWYTQVGNRAVEIVSMIRSGENKSSSTSPKAMPVQNAPAQIPEKLPSNSGSKSAPSVSQQNKTTNVFQGGTTYVATDEGSNRSPLIDKQYHN